MGMEPSYSVSERRMDYLGGLIILQYPPVLIIINTLSHASSREAMAIYAGIAFFKASTRFGNYPWALHLPYIWASPSFHFTVHARG